MTKPPWTVWAMSKFFAASVATPANWFSPVFPCLRNKELCATIIPFPRTGPQVIPGHVLAPRVVCYLPYPQAAPIEVDDFEPSDFGMTANDTMEPISSLRKLQELKHGEYTDVSKQLHEVISRGFENGYFISHAFTTVEERTDARLAAQLIDRITPDGLSKLYRIAGKLLFDWIDSCASQ